MNAREIREAELVQMIQSEQGQQKLRMLYKAIKGIPEGMTLPTGILFKEHIITAILEKEFPSPAP